MCPVSDTIASTDYWTPTFRETITSAKWIGHMALYRGHMLPVDGSTSAAANGAYDLGSSSYKWRNSYLTGYGYESVNTGITAFAGGGQGSATALTKQNNVITVCASDNDSVKLPSATAGQVIRVLNFQGSKNLSVYPSSGESINGVTNTSYTVEPRRLIEFICHTAQAWLPLNSSKFVSASTTYTITSNNTYLGVAGAGIQLDPGVYNLYGVSWVRRTASPSVQIYTIASAFSETTSGYTLTSNISIRGNDGGQIGFVQGGSASFEIIDSWWLNSHHKALVTATTTIYASSLVQVTSGSTPTNYVSTVYIYAERSAYGI